MIGMVRRMTRAGGGRPAGELGSETARGARRRAALAGVGAALLALAAGCAAPTPAAGRGSRVVPPADLVYVIPSGAETASLRGEPIFALPREIRLVAGQGVTVRNEDYAMHYFFFQPIAPGQQVTRRFDQPGQFGYSTVLSCSLGGKVETLSVYVAPASRA